MLGISPSQLRTFRGQAAAATGMRQAQRCATTAIEVGYGIDPAVEVISRQMVALFRYLRTVGVIGDLRVAWRAAREQIVMDGKVRWHKVHGPLGAIIAQMTEYGWSMSYIDYWVAPGGKSDVC